MLGTQRRVVRHDVTTSWVKEGMDITLRFRDYFVFQNAIP
jgi:hypothetical protein